MCDLFMPECLLDIDASGASVLHHFSEPFFVATEYRLPVFFFASAILALRHGALPKCPTSATTVGGKPSPTQPSRTRAPAIQFVNNGK
jgi:hypothetical protein